MRCEASLLQPVSTQQFSNGPKKQTKLKKNFSNFLSVQFIMCLIMYIQYFQGSNRIGSLSDRQILTVLNFCIDTRTFSYLLCFHLLQIFFFSKYLFCFDKNESVSSVQLILSNCRLIQKESVFSPHSFPFFLFSFLVCVPLKNRSGPGPSRCLIEAFFAFDKLNCV